MENYTEQTGYFKDPEPKQELLLDETGKALLLETARWAKFLSIIGFIFIFFYLMGGIAFVNAIVTSPESSTVLKGIGITGVVCLYALIGFIAIYPLYALFAFASKTKKAIKNIDTMTLNSALRMHKNYYLYNGILTIIFIGLYALVFLLIVIVGAVAS
ncbi:MAG: hypothetical protein JST82_02550 [Bacteroidetes bacterium]|nr:hypothetical protein [Bacteroidota bacterium]